MFALAVAFLIFRIFLRLKHAWSEHRAHHSEIPDPAGAHKRDRFELEEDKAQRVPQDGGFLRSAGLHCNDEIHIHFAMKASNGVNQMLPDSGLESGVDQDGIHSQRASSTASAENRKRNVENFIANGKFCVCS